MINKGSEDKTTYFNRELSYLKFEERVLNEAIEERNPLFEKLKFLAISGSNLDEFFMIRVASLKTLLNANFKEKDIAGMSVREQIDAVLKSAKALNKEQYRIFKEVVKKGLKASGIKLVDSYVNLSEKEKAYIDSYYEENIYPILTPLVINSQRPFPIIRNNYINVCGFVRRKNKPDLKEEFAIVQVPKGIERVVRINNGKNITCILVEEIIKSKFNNLFSSFYADNVYSFRVLRNADILIDEYPEENLLNALQKEVKKRDNTEPVRLEVEGKNSLEMISFLSKELKISKRQVFKAPGPIDLTFLNEIYNMKGFDNLRTPEYIPVMPWEFDERDLFEQIKEHDLMLIHPFESFKPVVDFIKTAARDKNVLAIKQTLYRVSGNSPIVKALAEAAKNGKQVTVMVELKARFDEENNIQWAKTLEKAGCNVIYGFANIKTHCKISLVIRKEKDGFKRYVHLGTGNYNDKTAKTYTDISFFTAKEDFGSDAVNVFNMLSGFSEESEFKKLSLAPMMLRERIIELINRETDNAKNNLPSHIIAKVNSLCDKEIIDALYEASMAGVKVDLIVRGICSLVPGVKGLSENITVRSIVGNFLEHSRMFCFYNAGEKEYYCSSADWMPRNMDKRIEILFPVERERLREKLNHVFKLMLKDNTKAWELNSDGTYSKLNKTKNTYSFQEGFCLEEKETFTGRK
ncbi:MAG: polyphosphate kinase 1 [Lachnospiraceae bacterium]|nr:polyphosphate kinase 1 [Lachnospiraceae bacterium]